MKKILTITLVLLALSMSVFASSVYDDYYYQEKLVQPTDCVGVKASYNLTFRDGKTQQKSADILAFWDETFNNSPVGCYFDFGVRLPLTDSGKYNSDGSISGIGNVGVFTDLNLSEMISIGLGVGLAVDVNFLGSAIWPVYSPWYDVYYGQRVDAYYVGVGLHARAAVDVHVSGFSLSVGAAVTASMFDYVSIKTAEGHTVNESNAYADFFQSITLSPYAAIGFRF